MKNTSINFCIEAKIKQAEDNINNSYQQYQEDIEGVKLLMPENKRYLIEEMAAETARLHTRIMRHARTHLRPYVSAHIRTILAVEAANDSLSAPEKSA